MKKRALKKDFYMEIKRNFGRFISIFFIVALGVAFYSGIQSAAPDMRLSGDAYFDENNLMDVEVIGTLGLTDGDVKALEELDGVKKAEPGYMTDVLCGSEDRRSVLHMESILSTLNTLRITSGTMPQNPGECLLDEKYADSAGYAVGDVLEVEEELEEDEDAVLKTHKYTVTGIGSSPAYISFSRGSTTLGNGEVSGFVYVLPDNFDMDVYTQIYLEAEGAKEATSFTDGYGDLVQKVKDTVEGIEGKRCKVRYQEIKAEADEKLADAKKELDDGKAEADEKLADAKKEIDDAQEQLLDGRKKLEDAKQELADGKEELNTKQAELDSAREEVADGWSKLADAKAQLTKKEEEFQKKKKSATKTITSGEKQIKKAKAALEENKKNLETKKTELEEAKKQYEAGKAAAEEAAKAIEAAVAAGQMTPEEAKERQQAAAGELEKLTAAGKQISDGESQIAAGEKELKAAEKTISSKEAKLQKGKKELSDGEAQIQAAWEEISAQEAKLNEAESQVASGASQIAEGWQKITDGEKEVTDAEAEIEEHEKELADGKQKYEEAKVEADEKIADGEKKIADAQEKIDGIKVPTWYVNDRDDLTEYTSYGENADRMKNIGEVFPVLFFLVAALISLTTMTRMVEEQRTQIGTLKALGYGKFSIASKYLGYAFLATIGGSVFGVLIGEKILPFIIIRAYGIMYQNMPNLEIPYNMGFALFATGAAVFCTMAATVSACYHELSSTPAVLMRPPSPKQGKRVLLERVTFLWKHLSFTWKSTIRNLFRYKKRFFMTIFGIGGCMALLLVGYGLRDSIMDVAILQYGDLQVYDAMILLDEDAADAQKEELNQHFAKEADINEYDDWYMKKITAKSQDGTREPYLVVPRNVEKFPDFVKLRDRHSKQVYALDEEGVILTEKTASLLNVDVGDTISLDLAEEQTAEVKISAICENYMSHYVYMTPGLYEKLAGSAPEYNSVVLEVEGQDEAVIQGIGENALAYDAALSVSYTGSIQDQLDDMLSSLDTVIIVLIVSAGMLAFVVLYNLNNININERKRELATIKVLGFFDKEVAAYVYRENILLTAIGVIVGSVLGVILHRFVIVTVEVDVCMFGRNINPLSFLYAILFTIGFSVVVNMVMYFKLKKIDMVESLKSVE